MITQENEERIRGWFTGRLPEEWQESAPRIDVDREEITVMLNLPDVRLADDVSEAEAAEARAGRVKAFREETREHRIGIAREAEHRFDRKVSWGVVIGDREQLFTHIAVPVMTRLKQPQRQVLDTLIEAGVARSRSEALAWCVRLVEQHAESWLTELREAMTHVADVRKKGPAA
jgi:Arc/MetJ-type ribon-helix-helix transcriptional regulator